MGTNYGLFLHLQCELTYQKKEEKKIEVNENEDRKNEEKGRRK